jgi:hypothetical protein
MSVLPIKYLTDLPFGCLYMSDTLNMHYSDIRLTLYLISYIQNYFRLLYKDIMGRFVYVRRNTLRH